VIYVVTANDASRTEKESAVEKLRGRTPFPIEVDITGYAGGSVLVSMDNALLICGVTIQENVPVISEFAEEPYSCHQTICYCREESGVNSREFFLGNFRVIRTSIYSARMPHSRISRKRISVKSPLVSKIKFVMS
jgi:hypothetical protein